MLSFEEFSNPRDREVVSPSATETGTGGLLGSAVGTGA